MGDNETDSPVEVQEEDAERYRKLVENRSGCFCNDEDPMLCSGRPPGHGCRCSCHDGWNR